MLLVHKSIEYSFLNPLVIDNQIDVAARLAAKHGISELCVPPYWVKKASREVTHTPVLLSTAVGYPLGYQRTEAKIAETDLAFSDGATAIELIINLSALKSQRMNWIKAEIARFSNKVHAREAMFTVSIESAYLSKTELTNFCKLSADAGADYVKSTTGFFGNETSAEDIAFLLQVLPSSVGIKAYTSTPNVSTIEMLISAGAQKIVVPTIDFLATN